MYITCGEMYESLFHYFRTVHFVISKCVIAEAEVAYVRMSMAQNID